MIENLCGIASDITHTLNGYSGVGKCLVFLFQKLLQLLHGFLDFIKTAAAGIFILIAEILEFLLKET